MTDRHTTNDTDPMSLFEGFHRFGGERPGDPEWGSFEVFWMDTDINWEGTAAVPEGWYWQPCWPGCLPDGEPNGPFDTSRAAYLDAQDWDS